MGRGIGDILVNACALCDLRGQFFFTLYAQYSSIYNLVMRYG
jgi:hypothetical protein